MRSDILKIGLKNERKVSFPCLSPTWVCLGWPEEVSAAALAPRRQPSAGIASLTVPPSCSSACAAHALLAGVQNCAVRAHSSENTVKCVTKTRLGFRERFAAGGLPALPRGGGKMVSSAGRLLQQSTPASLGCSANHSVSPVRHRRQQPSAAKPLLTS